MSSLFHKIIIPLFDGFHFSDVDDDGVYDYLYTEVFWNDMMMEPVCV